MNKYSLHKYYWNILEEYLSSLKLILMQVENCTFLEDKDIANQKMYLGDNKILVCNLLLEQGLFRHSIYSKYKCYKLKYTTGQGLQEDCPVNG